MNQLPPKFFLLFFRWFCHPKLRGHIEGDLIESYNRHLLKQGKRREGIRFALEVLLLFRPGIIKPLGRYKRVNNYSMLKSYVTTGWRSVWKNKGYSFINMSGLAVGMAGSILILLWLQNEISYDQFHPNKERLYEVYGLSNVDGKSYAISYTSQPLGPALAQTYPEVENFTRQTGTDYLLVTTETQRVSGLVGNFVDPSFLEIFNFPLLHGDKKDQLKGINTLVVTKRFARRLFGEDNAIGRAVKLGLTDDFTISGVLEDLPANTRFSFDYLLPWDYLRKLGWQNDEWLSNNVSTFVVLKDHSDVPSFNNKIKNFTRVNSGNNTVWTHFLFPAGQWHLYSKFENGIPSGGQIEMVKLFGIVAIFILLIACINFMNLSTARSEKRAKEVGVRKVVGAGRSLLIGQFYTEAFIMSLLSGVCALSIVTLVLPAFNSIIGTPLVLPLFNPSFWLCSLGFLLFTSLLAGIYPSLYLSSFHPIGIFKHQVTRRQGVFSFRKTLVVLQFTFATILIISTIVVRNQILFAENRDSGYSRNNLINVDFSGDIEKKYALIKKDLLDAGVATSVTKNLRAITRGGNRAWNFRWPGQTASEAENLTMTYFSTDADLVKTASMTLVEGRDIDIYQYPSDSFAIVLNETAVKVMGFTHPLGQIIIQPGQGRSWHVVGVVKDYIEGSPFAKVPPCIIEGPASEFGTMHIKLNGAKGTAESLAEAERIFKSHNPDYPFDYHFIDQDYAIRFKDEERSKSLAGLFAFLAIFISCLGLFGLASYVAEQRTKEIGIRKVMGASVLTIWKMLSQDFLLLVTISLIVSTPFSYYLMSNWLSRFEYRTEISWPVYAIASALTLLVTLVVVSYQSIKAAVANPVKSLRSE